MESSTCPACHIALQTNKELKQQMADLAMRTIGQHLWGLWARFPKADFSACICSLCVRARVVYTNATGLPPTTEQEHTAARSWDQSTPKY